MFERVWKCMCEVLESFEVHGSFQKRLKVVIIRLKVLKHIETWLMIVFKSVFKRNDEVLKSFEVYGSLQKRLQVFIIS